VAAAPEAVWEVDIDAGIAGVEILRALERKYSRAWAHPGRDSGPSRKTTIRTVQELPGYSDVTATMVYTHVLKLGGSAVRSPLDTLAKLANLAPQRG
jgi:hypothetical protein